MLRHLQTYHTTECNAKQYSKSFEDREIAGQRVCRLIRHFPETASHWIFVLRFRNGNGRNRSMLKSGVWLLHEQIYDVQWPHFYIWTRFCEAWQSVWVAWAGAVFVSPFVEDVFLPNRRINGQCKFLDRSCFGDRLPLLLCPTFAHMLSVARSGKAAELQLWSRPFILQMNHELRTL